MIVVDVVDITSCWWLGKCGHSYKQYEANIKKFTTDDILYSSSMEFEDSIELLKGVYIEIGYYVTTSRYTVINEQVVIDTPSIVN